MTRCPSCGSLVQRVFVGPLIHGECLECGASWTRRDGRAVIEPAGAEGTEGTPPAPERATRATRA
jgi:hypothetical protein